MYVRRKVFSNVEQPVEEQLYSVDMTEEQYSLFSAFMEGYNAAIEERSFSAEAQAALKAKLAKEGNVSMTTEQKLQWMKDFDAGKNGGKDISGRINDTRVKIKNGNYETSYIKRGQKEAPLKGAEKKAAKKAVKQAAKDTEKIMEANLHPTNNAGGKSAKAAAEVLETAPDKFKNKIAMADAKRFLGKNKKALALGGGAAALTGAGVYGYKKVANKA